MDVQALPIDNLGHDLLKYSFCTLVTKMDEYEAMVLAFRAKGFGSMDCEFVYIDNSDQSNLDAFAGYNLFLSRSVATYVILCHQDILPIMDDRSKLDHCLAELTQRDPYWGLCGNAGYNESGSPVFRITDPRGEQSFGDPWPAPVMSLDENFIVVRRIANLALSRDLTGFHWYGSDLCIVADILGWSAYVIDFHLKHNSGGNVDTAFYEARKSIQLKYRRAFRSRLHYVPTNEPVYISSSRILTKLNRINRITKATTRRIHSHMCRILSNLKLFF